MQHEVIGSSDVFLNMLEKTSRLAKIAKPILIFGERGSGKELIAERLHFLSPRWDQPFIKINCAALSDSLLEAELFGHEQGAYTGAHRSRPGKFKRAHGGTIFLDEIGTASLALQEKLLRVIEYGEFEGVGGGKLEEVDVRVIAATNLDLREAVQSGDFRADLLDRLCFDVITPPPLRERKEDLLVLAEFFGKRMQQQLHRVQPLTFSAGFKTQLYDHSWPGNVRELRNAIERSVFHFDGAGDLDVLVIDPFPRPVTTTESAKSGEFSYDPEVSLPENIKKLEQLIIHRELGRTNFNQTEAAKSLKVSYHQFRNYLKKYNMIGSQVNH